MKKLIAGGLVLLVIWVVGFSVFLGLRFKNSYQQAAIPTSPEATTGRGSDQQNRAAQETSEKWARDLVAMDEYKKGSYSGILPGSSKTEVWVIGRKTTPDKIFPGTSYFAIKNNAGTFTAKTSNGTLYTYQVGDDNFGPTPNSTSAASLKTGDFVAARTTFSNNFGLILEIRRLIRPQAK